MVRVTGTHVSVKAANDGVARDDFLRKRFAPKRDTEKLASGT